MAYDIYDTDTANLVGSFRTEEEALEVIREAVQEDGPESVLSWAMGRTDRTGKAISGRELIDRAMPTAAV